jgi:HlyD family secretion protein
MARQQQEPNSAGRRRMWLVIAGAGLAVVMLAAFMSRNRDVQVRAEKAARETITATVQTNGKIEPINNFEAHAPAATTVKRIYVHEGQHVKAGQLLLTLDDAQAQADAARALAQIRAAEAGLSAVRQGGTREEVLTNQSELTRAKAELQAAQRNLDAMQSLEKQGAASPGEVLDAQNRLKTAQAQVTLLEQKQNSRYSRPDIARAEAQEEEAKAAYAAAQDLLRKSEVRSAEAGVVYFLPVHQGQFVNAGDLLVQVANLSKVRLLAFVDEPDIGKLAPGQQVKVRWDALPDRVWEGKVSQVPTTVVTRGTRNVGEFTCIVDNPEEKLLPNINVNLNIVTAQHENALTVPREAIHQDDDQRFVYQVKDGELQRTPVQISVSTLTRVEVTNGLPEGALVALSATDGKPLKAGMSVKVVQE